MTVTMERELSPPESFCIPWRLYGTNDYFTSNVIAGQVFCPD